MGKFFDPRETSFGITNKSFGLGVVVLLLLFLIAYLILGLQVARARVGELFVAVGVLNSCDLQWFESSLVASMKVVFPLVGWVIGVAQGALKNLRLELDVREAIQQKDIVFFSIPVIFLTVSVLATVVMLDLCSYGDQGIGRRVWRKEYGIGVGFLTYFSSLVATTYCLSSVRCFFRRDA